jgi:opacity protein-like surface antigen
VNRDECVNNSNLKDLDVRTYLPMAAVAALFVSPAVLAQPANPQGNTPAVNTPNSPPNPGAPVSGANSFTEGQAKSRIESQGFTNVSGLRKDDQGVWRGMATKDGRGVNVSLDFQGNVVAQ